MARAADPSPVLSRERHKELTAKLERDGDADVVAKARQLLADMPPRSNA